jgi:hypothetical protein
MSPSKSKSAPKTGKATAAPPAAPAAAPGPTPAAPPTPSPIDAVLPWLPVVGLGLVTFLAAVMYHHVFAGEFVGDDNSFHLAEATRMADCIRAGDWDFWNPSANAGYASAYYYQTLPLLAPAVLAAISGTDVLPWFQLCVFLALVLAPAAAYRGMRVVGATSWQSLGAAFAIVVCASNNRWGFGADGTFSVGLYTQTVSLAAFPLALGHGIRWVRDGAGLAPAVAWAVFVTITHPFAGIALGLALGAGAIVVAVLQRLIPHLREYPGLAPVRYGLDVRRWGDPFLPDEPPREPDAPVVPIAALAVRLVVLGGMLVVGAASIWATVLVDYAGFGGFPHRVADEVGPGFKLLFDWLVEGKTLDCDRFENRWRLLTALLPFTFVFGRGRAMAWMWGGAITFALLLGVGPNLGPRGGDDLFPMVRFYGPFQICLALAIGAGVVALGQALWERSFLLGDAGSLVAQAVLASGATALVVALAISGVRIGDARTKTIYDLPRYSREQIREVGRALAEQPIGRKLGRDGMDNHFGNLLPYIDARVPALFQMGGGGLQASPNYDYLWNISTDVPRLAWVFDAPYIAFGNDHAADMPDGETVVSTELYSVRRINAPGLVSPVEVKPTPLPPGRFAARQAAIAWVKSDDALADKLAAYTGSEGLSAAPTGTVLDVKRQDSPGDEPDIVARVRAEAPTTFVVRESWHPRWRAFVDQKEVKVRRVTPDFFAVDVPAGEHALAFRFDRPWWAWGVWLLSILVVVAGWRFGPRLGRLFAIAAPQHDR